jgi:bifunctional enzyme CysN/CysC
MALAAPSAPVFGPKAAAMASPSSRSLLRFITCGSVDDGKSTLLGRLLWETGAVFEDQADALARDSERFGTNGKAVDYALLVDGLSAEREQGITIDVAYRYFSTPRRALIAADTPGHEQYTRNMATGASTADAAILLIDARKGLLPQTRRHASIVSMVGVRHVIVAINKMDLVGFDEARFQAIARDFRLLAEGLGFRSIHLIPMIARDGDNLSQPSTRLGWYRGPTLLELLETLEPEAEGDGRFRLPVQWVNRPNSEFRGFSGTISSGRIRVGDAVAILPAGRTTRIAEILTPQGTAIEAGAGEAVTVTLADETDVSRGDVIVASRQAGPSLATFTGRVLVLSDRALVEGDRVLVKLGTALIPARIERLESRLDIGTQTLEATASLGLNMIGHVVIRPEAPLTAEQYADCRTLGSFLIIDAMTQASLGMGIVDAVAVSQTEVVQEQAKGHSRAWEGIWPADPLGRSARIGAIILAFLIGGLLGLAFGAGAGSALISAILVTFWEALIRPFVRRLHDRVWARIKARQAARLADFSLDGGGI